MSDTEAVGAKGKIGWSDRQRLAYFFNLVDFSKVKLDYANAPRPEGKSVGACQIMVHRLKGTLKDDLDALRAGTAMPEDTPKKTPKSTPRKRKGKGVDVNDDAEASPSKKGRKKKEAVSEQAADEEEDEEKLQVKMEVADEKMHAED